MLANVVSIYDNKIYDNIQRFFDKLERRSLNTRKTYEADVKFYFRLMKNKELEYITVDDVSLTLDDFEDYLDKLINLKDDKGKTYSNGTINKKVTALKELLKYLYIKKVIEDISFLPIVESLKHHAENIDPLTIDECFKIADLAAQERDKGDEKRLLILLALDTSIRKSALLNLQWSNFKVNDYDVSIEGIDKGDKAFTKSISKPFYNELLTIKLDSPNVFSFPVTTVDKMFNRLRDKIGLSPDKTDRKISFHSLRKSGGGFVYEQTKDLNAARLYLNHSNSVTTQLYIPKNNQYGAIGAVSIRDSIDSDLFKNSTLDELVNAISELDSGQILLINKKIMENRNKTLDNSQL